MKTITSVLLTFCLAFLFLCESKIISAEEFPLPQKGWQATLIRLERINTSKALAVGEVKYENAKEYCERDPGGETIKYGGKLTTEQCIQKVLKEEKGKLYSASADCPRKILSNYDGTFTLLGKSPEMGDGIWRNDLTGKTLLQENRTDGRTWDEQYKLLCPAFAR